jgi:hypothetical protein
MAGMEKKRFWSPTSVLGLIISIGDDSVDSAGNGVIYLDF